MDFRYIVYSAGFKLWKYFLNNGYPISINLINDIMSDSKYVEQILERYKREYSQLKDKSIQHIDEFKSPDIVEWFIIEGFDFTLFGTNDTKILTKYNIDQTILDKLKERFRLACNHIYSNIVEYEPSFLLNPKSQLKYRIIFIDYINLEEYDTGISEFISNDLTIFEQILEKEKLNFIRLKNELQSKIFISLNNLKISESDYTSIESIDFAIDQLHNEPQFAYYLKTFFESIEKVDNEEIKIKIVDGVKFALEDRIKRIANLHGAPKTNWLELNWNSTQIDNDQHTFKSTLSHEPETLMNYIVLKGKEDIIFNAIKVYFKQEDHEELYKVLKGENIPRKLEWRDSKVLLATYFYQFNNNGYLIKGPKKVLAKWIVNCFSLIDTSTKFDERSILLILEDENRRTKKPIIIN